MAVENQFRDNDNVKDKTRLLSQNEELYTSDCSTESIDLSSRIDEIVDSLDIGLFHYIITLICGLGYSGYSIFYQSIGFVIISACDLDINRNNKGWLSLAYMIGLAIGASIFGRLADVYGRRKILVIALLINLIGMLASAFAYNYLMLVIMFGLVGSTHAAVVAAIHSYLLEFFPRRYRGRAAAVLSSFLIFGNIYGSVIALVILPHSFYSPIGAIYFTNWRLYLLVDSVPSLLSFCALLFLPRSLRFVIAKNDKKGLRDVLNKINQINSCYKTEVDSYQQVIYCKVGHRNLPIEEMSDNIENDKGNTFLQDIRELLQPPWRKRLLLMSLVQLGYYVAEQGLTIWLPTVIAYYVNGQTCWHHHHSGKNNNLSWYTTHSSQNVASDCQSGNNIRTVILNIFLGHLISIPIAILCVLLINRIGRKALYIILASMSGLCILLLLIIDNLQGVLILACIFTSIMTNGWTPLKIWNTELFRTEFRATAQGIIGVNGHLGGALGMIIFAALFYTNCIATYTIFSALGFLSAFLALFLPDTTNLDIG
ncbi:Synaptic vesicle glycoprotein 2A [Trichoplax sp. H2]|nr:Synaptic vesicle glycoprotein 2A [Trichoplax sp. H2]|eukprot:RDD37985.1 Synaptic vesicle glycoprotein 2A [Trichoplax sp. H2]